MSLNYEKLARQVDEVLAKETKESLIKWLADKRKEIMSMELKLKKPIEISLEYDDNTASLIEEREEKLTNGLDVTFTLDIVVEEKVLRGVTYYEKDDVEVIVSHIEISDIRFFDGEEEIFLAEKDYQEMEKDIKGSIEF